MHLLDYFYFYGGVGAQRKLAKTIGAPAPNISKWAHGRRAVPIARCIPIEKATEGRVTRKDLRPHDWHELWPEIADATTKTS